MVADLLTGFIRPAWLSLVDLDTLEPYKASFITDGLVGYLIAIGQCGSVNEIRACIERLREHTRSPQDEQIQRTFAIWLSRLLRTRFRDDAIPEYQNLQEVHTMLAETIDKWVQDAENRGEAKGEATMLQRLLTHKFGSIPEAVQQKIQAATPNQLETWSLNILDAKTLDEVFLEDRQNGSL